MILMRVGSRTLLNHVLFSFITAYNTAALLSANIIKVFDWHFLLVSFFFVI